MAAKDFKYEEFAQNLAGQAQGLVPQDFNDEQKQYVINTLGNFSMMAGKALAEDPNLNFNAEQSSYITQIIAEWSFHKAVDVIRSGIPRQYWDSVMQKIAYTIFEVAKQAFSQNLPNDQILELIEHHVKKTYVDALNELKEKEIIDENLLEFAASQSNMEVMAQQLQQQQAEANQQQVPGQDPALRQVAGGGGASVPVQSQSFAKVDSKTLKLATVAMLFNRMNRDQVQAILNVFDEQEAETVIKFMQMSDLGERVGAHNALRCLQEIKMNLPKNSEMTPVKVVKRLKHFASQYSGKQLDTMLIKERIGVKRLVFSAIEDKFYDKMPPKVASVIATHLLNSV